MEGDAPTPRSGNRGHTHRSRSAGPGRPGPLLSLLAVLVLPGTAGAHGFEVPYALPVPLELYLAGSAAAVLLSFVVAVAFLRREEASLAYPRLDLLEFPFFRFLVGRPFTRAAEIASVVIFLLVITAGMIGSPQASHNLAPTFIWVAWWVGMSFVSALVGNVWPLINPWRILFEWAERGARALDAELSLNLRYPRALASWPAVLLFFAFAWFENAFHDPSNPAILASVALFYSLLTWGGMILFGRDTWLRHGEVFTLVFGILARFAPLETRVAGEACRGCGDCRAADGECVDCCECFRQAPQGQRNLYLRPYAAGLLSPRGIDLSKTVLVILLLATVTFDGFSDTPTWAATVFGYYSTLGHLNGLNTLALVAFPIVFLALFLLSIGLMRPLAGVRLGVIEGAKAFVLTLVPIALAYHLGHYLVYLLLQGQDLIRLASDPFGWGWDLFGTAGFEVNGGLVGARFAWFLAVGAVVAGHAIAVWLGHIVALHRFRSRTVALRSQLPLLVLMLAYTVSSLWILAQPIVET